MDLFESLFQAHQVSGLAADLEGRQLPYLAIVVNNQDPKGARRIQVDDPANPGLRSPWLRRLEPWPDFDPPLPQISQTVLVVGIDNDFTNGWYLSCVNQLNPPLNKSDVVNDFASRVPGEQVERTDKNRTIDVGSSLLLRTDAGSSIHLTESGSVIITSSSGSSFNLDSGIVTSTNSFTVGGKEIASVGAADGDDGDVLVTRGW